MSNQPFALVLFDVDGTLVRTEGPSPHSRAFRAAFKEVFGVDCQFTRGLHGMVDLQIFMTLAQDMGLGDGQLLEQALRACRTMVQVYQTRNETDGHYVALPGARAALESLARRGALLGLLTGNAPEIAADKLASVGLREFFSFGAYGTEALDRSALPPMAIARAEALIGRPIERRSVFVVGDTARDVACALDNNCRAVAVATGHVPFAELEAAGAELVLPDLQDIEPLLRLTKLSCPEMP